MPRVCKEWTDEELKELYRLREVEHLTWEAIDARLDRVGSRNAFRRYYGEPKISRVVSKNGKWRDGKERLRFEMYISKKVKNKLQQYADEKFGGNRRQAVSYIVTQVMKHYEPENE